MKISYNWLKEYVPGIPEPEQLSKILTSVGLEVEGIERFEAVKGNLEGLIAGEVLTCEKHPEADRLKVTEVDTGGGNTLQIVCGAPNVAAGQKVIVAPPGATIYPLSGEPIFLKKIKIRGIESSGMICAEDEIGIGASHDGIVILPDEIQAGNAIAAWFKPSDDWIFEIGLTPNRIDAMSHMGVARDVCAYLSHELGQEVVVSDTSTIFNTDSSDLPVNIIIENTDACERYAGVSITGIKICASPSWMQLKLRSIGVRPINNIVDITNYILHATGQPLHAFDLQSIKENRILIKNLPAGTSFTTLDEKERKLHPDDLMICNGRNEPLCFGGVFGGLSSGIKDSTTHIFLESAWFNPAVVRRTSLRYNLRTEAAIRFEKGVDISQTAEALKKAAMLIKELAGGKIVSEIADIYPNPRQQHIITLQNGYLTKLSGKEYRRNEVKSILQSLGFQIQDEEGESITVAVPFSKPDVTLPADVVEEIIRIDGFDNIEIPSAITITPALQDNFLETSLQENISAYLAGAGFSEIFTNSITNSKYYGKTTLLKSVKILNSLSSDLDIMRPYLMETGLESIVYNLNRKNNDLLFFEFGNTYFTTGVGIYREHKHLGLYVSGNKPGAGWKERPVKADFYFLKGICENIFNLCGLNNVKYEPGKDDSLEACLFCYADGIEAGKLGMIDKSVLQHFDIKQPVLFADLDWRNILRSSKKTTVYKEIPKFPSVHRDLSIVVNKAIEYAQIESIIKSLSIKNLDQVKLFDVFESPKLGTDKKAFAIAFTFTDTKKTLTDTEIDTWMNKYIAAFTIKLDAEIRN